jgi:hypothetical protein
MKIYRIIIYWEELSHEVQDSPIPVANLVIEKIHLSIFRLHPRPQVQRL